MIRLALSDDLRQVTGDPEGTDYAESPSKILRAIDALRKSTDHGGWIVEAWSDERSRRSGDPPLGDWTRGEHVSLRRSWLLRRRRSPDHQALVEALEQVQPGDNEYVHPHSERVSGSVGQVHEDSRDVYGDVLELALGLASRAKRRGPRPRNRERDLT